MIVKLYFIIWCCWLNFSWVSLSRSLLTIKTKENIREIDKFTPITLKENGLSSQPYHGLCLP